MRGNERQGTRANERKVQAVGLSPIGSGVIEHDRKQVF